MRDCAAPPHPGIYRVPSGKWTRVYCHQGKKSVCIGQVSLKRGSTVLACPANCSLDLYVTRMITGHRNGGGPFSEYRGKNSVVN